MKPTVVNSGLVSGADSISGVLPSSRLWYAKAPDAVDHAKLCGQSHDSVIRAYEWVPAMCRENPPAALNATPVVRAVF
jgi:hypothetical protein